MAAYLSPIGNDQQCDANGAPLSGGKIYTYQAGTTTPVATYTDSTGATPQANPITLNSLGLPASPIWLPAGQAVKLVIQNAALVTQRTVDNVLGVNDPTNAGAVSEWLLFAGAPTYISATSFSVGGDQTASFQVGRRVKTANTAGTVYSTVTVSSYNAGTGRTTLTVVNDSGTLDSGLSQVSYGLLAYTNHSIPGRVLKASNGYKVWPDGMIEQWGSTTMSSAGVATNFPIPFPTGCVHVAVTHLGTGPAAVGGVAYTTTASAVTLYSQGAGPFQATYRATGY